MSVQESTNSHLQRQIDTSEPPSASLQPSGIPIPAALAAISLAAPATVVVAKPFPPFTLTSIIKEFEVCHFAEALKLIQEAIANSNGDTAVIENFKTQYAEYTILHLAARAGDLETVKYLIQRLPLSALTVKDIYGDIPLHKAAVFPYADRVLMLPIETHPTTIYAKNESGEMLLHEALSTAGHIVKFLIEIDPKTIYAKNNQGNIPLHKAIKCGQEENVSLLIKTDPTTIYAKNNEGETPLHVAVQGFRAKITRTLIEIEPKSIYVKNNRGHTPLDWVDQEARNTIQAEICTWKRIRALLKHRKEGLPISDDIPREMPQGMLSQPTDYYHWRTPPPNH